MKFAILNTVINGSNATVNTGDSAGNTVGFLGSSMGIIIYFIVIIAIFYFISIKPQRKREKKLAEVQNSIAVGDSVITDSGLYGRVTDISDQVFLVEFGTNKSVIVPVIKQRIIAKSEPNLTKTPKSE